MKLPQKVHNISDIGILPTKLEEKSKGTKKPVEKIINNRGLIVWDAVGNSTEILHSKTEAESVAMKKGSVELRQTEGTEWKSLKKVDYLRLETVLEEGQQSSEEGISKKLESCTLKRSEKDEEKNKSNIYVTVGGKEAPKEEEEGEGGEEEEEEDEDEDEHEDGDEEIDEIDDVEMEKDKKEILAYDSEEGNPEETEKAGNEMKKSKADSVTVAFSINKKGLIPSGKMEILPIFSNDRFQCSRDAISIGECEDLCGLEKNLRDSKRENKTDRPEIEKNEKAEVKSPPKSAPAANTSVLAERKLRFKAFTEKHMPQTHSHFVNSLLVLAPFSEERKNLLNEKVQNMKSAIEERFQLAEASTSNIKKSPTDLSFVDEGTNTLHVPWRVLFIFPIYLLVQTFSGGHAFSFSSIESFNCWPEFLVHEVLCVDLCLTSGIRVSPVQNVTLEKVFHLIKLFNFILPNYLLFNPVLTFLR